MQSSARVTDGGRRPDRWPQREAAEEEEEEEEEEEGGHVEATIQSGQYYRGRDLQAGRPAAVGRGHSGREGELAKIASVFPIARHRRRRRRQVGRACDPSVHRGLLDEGRGRGR